MHSLLFHPLKIEAEVDQIQNSYGTTPVLRLRLDGFNGTDIDIFMNRKQLADVLSNLIHGFVKDQVNLGLNGKEEYLAKQELAKQEFLKNEGDTYPEDKIL